MKQQEKNGITEGIIWKQLMFFFFPILIGVFFQQLYNTIDALVVGRFAGKEALSCVGGSSSTIINLVVGFFTGISTGASVIIAQYFGARDKKGLQDALHTAFSFALVGGIVLGILGILLAPGVLRMMNTPEELLRDSSLYVRIYFAGLLFVLIYNIGAAMLRAIGDTKRPLIFLIACCFVNILLDLIFVVGCGLGVVGVAIATLVSQGISAVLVTYTLMYHTEEMKLDLRSLTMKKDVLIKLLWIGLPTGLESAMYGISNIIIQAALNNFGVDTMAAWAIYGKIDGFFWMINNAFGVSITTFVGQNYGAKKWERIKKGVNLCLIIAISVAVVMSIILLVASKQLFGIFTTDTNVVMIGVRMMSIITPTYFLFEFIEIYSGALRAQGYVIVSSLMVLCGTCFFRIVWITLITVGKSMEQVILCYPITWGICAVAFIFYYHYKQKRIFDV